MSIHEFSFGTMTPDIPSSGLHSAASIQENSNNNMGNISRKMSKSSIDLSIPSPPLSPYQTSNTRGSPNVSNVLRDVQSREANKAVANTGKPVETFVLLKNNTTDLREFPLNNLENYPLVVNAWSNVGSKSFKQSQLNFIRQYASRSKKHGVKVGKANSSRRFAPRRLVKTVYQDVPTTSYFSNGYNSDSDYNSQFEKVRTRRVARESSQQPSFDSDVPSRVSTPTIKRRKPAAISSPAAPVNIDWESLPDFAPDVSLLPNNARCLRVEWKGQPMDLSSDPLVDKLHPAEVTLASILRLPCNLYLDSKRRLFMEKVARLKRNLPFRRTDAQKSCKIDVNKASRLFAAFEKIGWLEDDKFARFL